MASPLNRTLVLTEAERTQSVHTVAELTKRSPRSGVYAGDVLAALERLPSHSFDLITADPPYNYGLDFGNDSDRQSDRDYRAWARAWLRLLWRVATPTASLYVCCGWEYSGFYQEAIAEAGFHLLNRITWKREKGRGAKKNWKQNMEDIWFAVCDKKHYTFNLENVKLRKQVIAPYRENGAPKDWRMGEDGKPFRMTHPSNIWSDLTVPFWSMPENTPHPAQKPEALAERVLLASTDRGDRVLDLFSGSGTFSVVANRLGRKYIGIEMNEEYVRYAMKRLAMTED